MVSGLKIFTCGACDPFFASFVPPALSWAQETGAEPSTTANTAEPANLIIRSSPGCQAPNRHYSRSKSHNPVSSMETTQKIHARAVQRRLRACENRVRRKYEKCQESPHRKPQPPPAKRRKRRQGSRLPPTTKSPY